MSTHEPPPSSTRNTRSARLAGPETSNHRPAPALALGRSAKGGEFSPQVGGIRTESGQKAAAEKHASGQIIAARFIDLDAFMPKLGCVGALLLPRVSS